MQESKSKQKRQQLKQIVNDSEDNEEPISHKLQVTTKCAVSNCTEIVILVMLYDMLSYNVMYHIMK